jgi:hypothetical protein
LGLEVSETEKGCGMEQHFKYYRDPKSVFANTMAKLGMPIYNDINKPFWERNYLNIAMLRVIPGRNGEVKVPLTSYPTIKEMRDMSEVLKKVFKETLETLCNLEITLVFKKDVAQ